MPAAGFAVRPQAGFDESALTGVAPPDALLPDYVHMLKTVGVSRHVLVQPSVYGTDNTVMLEAMKASPLPCRA